MEKGNPTDIVSKFIPALLGEENFDNNPVKVDCVHRAHVQATATDGPPRQFITWIHHDSVKERILRLSSQRFPLQYEGACIFIFPDLDPAVMKHWQQFDNIRTRVYISWYMPAFAGITCSCLADENINGQNICWGIC